jgi:hypothetical protein
VQLGEKGYATPQLIDTQKAQVAQLQKLLFGGNAMIAVLVALKLSTDNCIDVKDSANFSVGGRGVARQGRQRASWA